MFDNDTQGLNKAEGWQKYTKTLHVCLYHSRDALVVDIEDVFTWAALIDVQLQLIRNTPCYN